MVAGFEELARRLLAQARAAVRRGEVSERGLAKLCGYSQPHLHNVLAGVRGLQPGLADRLLAALELSLLDLHTAAERAVEDPEAAPRATSSRIPLLEGPLGAGGPFPRKPWRPRHLNLPFLNPAPAANPVAAVVSSLEGAMWPAVSPGDLVVLERSPAARRSPTFGGVYAIYWRGPGIPAPLPAGGTSADARRGSGDGRRGAAASTRARIARLAALCTRASGLARPRRAVGKL